MSRSLGNQLPGALLQLLDGRDLGQKTQLALLLNTVDAQGYPHPAMLSVGEVLAPSPSALRLALYATSTTTSNLRRGGTLSLALASGGLAYYIKARARERAGPLPGLEGLAVFDADIAEVLEDGDPMAAVTSGFTIALSRDPAAIVAHWEQVIAALRALP
ncbi:MAG TPA: pyridoxamine 5-phosphate oxidase [Chloroflexota bacterium]|jgi:hypothetical protein|nr:pyridoxamine 5-phosphate oxidase [Chloroflexota bacterium]HZU05226.1 pyridoxamine 5-phosphate oxidase [Chloroflexota bacterium]